MEKKKKFSSVHPVNNIASCSNIMWPTPPPSPGVSIPPLRILDRPTHSLMSAFPKAPVPVAGLHAGSKSDFGEDLDVDELIERNRCHEDYYKLEDCLANFDRDWTKCQQQVKQLKLCNDRVNQLRKAQEAAAINKKQ